MNAEGIKLDARSALTAGEGHSGSIKTVFWKASNNLRLLPEPLPGYLNFDVGFAQDSPPPSAARVPLS